MRVDSINLVGGFKINGSVGQDSQAIGISGSSAAWVQVSSSVPQEGLLKTSGYNYVIVTAQGTNLQNGENLISKYATAKALNVGDKSPTNKITLLLMPGVYDLGSSELTLDTNFVDIIGISNNPYDTQIRTNAARTIVLSVTDMNFTLMNVHLGSGASLAIKDTTSTNITLRWKNIVLEGNGFYDGGSEYAFHTLVGSSFEDIKCLSGVYFLVCYSSIETICKNIELDNSPLSFYTTVNIIGDYRNIKGNLSGSCFYSGNSIYGTFENIEIQSTTAYIFYCNNEIWGTFKNIKVSGTIDYIFYSAFIGYLNEIRLENIDLGNLFITTSAFYASNNFDATCKNIEIGNYGSYCFYASSMLGTYSSISIGDGGDCFYSSDTNINIKDLTAGNVGTFLSSGSTLQGKFENIKSGNIAGNCFYSSSITSGNFKNVEIGNVTGLLFSSYDLQPNIDGLKVLDCSSDAFYSSNTIYGSYKNIEMGILSGTKNFYSDNELNIDCDNLSIDSTVGCFFGTNLFTGTFSNINIKSSSESSFLSWISISGYYENIFINSIGYWDYFSTSKNPITVNGTFKNIKILGSNRYILNGINININLDGLEVDTCDRLIYCQDDGSTTAGKLFGTYKNIKANIINVDIFYFYTLNAKFFNISSNYAQRLFYSDGNEIPHARIENFYVGDSSTMFGYSSSDNSNLEINRLNANTLFMGYSSTNTLFGGKLLNSTINGLGKGTDYLRLDSNAVIQRCKIYMDGSNGGGSGIIILGSDPKVIYTEVNANLEGISNETYWNISTKA
jgi:hypothetical protein